MIISKLEVLSQNVGTGFDWELTFEIAVLINALNAKYNGSAGPFGILYNRKMGASGTFLNPNIELNVMPPQITTLKQAQDSIDKIIDKKKR